MVDFGPRLTGSPGHLRYVAWLERQFLNAGLQLEPCDIYKTDRWLARKVDLKLLDGSAPGPVRVAAYYTRCAETGERGVDGPLVYAGVAPAPSLNTGDPGLGLPNALAAYPADLASWAAALGGTLGGSPRGSVLLVDLPLPLPLTSSVFLALATHLNWPGHSEADWLGADFKRSWILPGAAAIPLTPFKALGAKAVVFVLDSSYQALKGAYLPFRSDFQDFPALFVDRDTGAMLRGQAASRPRAKLTLTASRRKARAPSVTAVLPGQSDETLIFNSHTDGQGFVEENAGVAFVQLARHFASLPRSRRPKRTLVFACWPGHMSSDLPETKGWIDDHPDFVDRAAAALTVEHLGCSEWSDTESGYRPTGEAEMFAVWTSLGKMFEVTRSSVVDHRLPRTALLRPGVQFGVGGAFQAAGVPQIGAIAGPAYLLNINKDGDMDKLDAKLAARQIAWLADLVMRLDRVPRAELRQGDPTLGGPSPLGSDHPDQKTKRGRC
ncbi:MAG: hypothetical protein QOG62_1501 [Thermoleophilaceae bacterium]|nr:hypothetical protein [Thermoleophilaceae bacterium]